MNSEREAKLCRIVLRKQVLPRFRRPGADRGPYILPGCIREGAVGASTVQINYRPSQGAFGV